MARPLSIVLFLLLCTLAPAAFGWARLGHQLVAELAWRHLDPAARAQVAQLLAGEPEPTLAGIASWADDLRNSDPTRFKQTSNWHYINARGGGCDFQLLRDCPDGACVVGAIEKQLAVLANRNQPFEARRDALKFVVHFVGDVHQPMHAGDREDAGGNKYQISLRTELEPEAYARKSYVDGVMGTNMHSVWDYYILGEAGLKFLPYADRLDALPWPPTPTTLSPPLAWAQESCRLIGARSLYPDGHKLDQSYSDAMRPLAEQRIRQAAWRLADLLNSALGQPAATASP